MPSKRCPSCNTWNTDAANFCRNCGTKLTVAQAQKPSGGNVTTSGSTGTKKKTGAKKKVETSEVWELIGIILLTLLLIGGIIGAFVMFFNGTVTKIVAVGVVYLCVMGLKKIYSDW